MDIQRFNELANDCYTRAEAVRWFVAMLADHFGDDLQQHLAEQIADRANRLPEVVKEAGRMLPSMPDELIAAGDGTDWHQEAIHYGAAVFGALGVAIDAGYLSGRQIGLFSADSVTARWSEIREQLDALPPVNTSIPDKLRLQFAKAKLSMKPAAVGEDEKPTIVALRELSQNRRAVVDFLLGCDHYEASLSQIRKACYKGTTTSDQAIEKCIREASDILIPHGWEIDLKNRSAQLRRLTNK